METEQSHSKNISPISPLALLDSEPRAGRGCALPHPFPSSRPSAASARRGPPSPPVPPQLHPAPTPCTYTLYLRPPRVTMLPSDIRRCYPPGINTRRWAAFAAPRSAFRAPTRRAAARGAGTALQRARRRPLFSRWRPCGGGGGGRGAQGRPQPHALALLPLPPLPSPPSPFCFASPSRARNRHHDGGGPRQEGEPHEGAPP